MRPDRAEFLANLARVRVALDDEPDPATAALLRELILKDARPAWRAWAEETLHTRYVEFADVLAARPGPPGFPVPPSPGDADGGDGGPGFRTGTFGPNGFVPDPPRDDRDGPGLPDAIPAPPPLPAPVGDDGFERSPGDRTPPRLPTLTPDPVPTGSPPVGPSPDDPGGFDPFGPAPLFAPDPRPDSDADRPFGDPDAVTPLFPEASRD